MKFQHSIFVLLTFTFLLAPSLTQAQDEANCISFGKNSFSGAQTFFENLTQKVSGDISRLSLKETFGIGKKAGDNLYMSVYKDLVQGSTKKTLNVTAQRYKLSSDDASKVLDGDVTPLLVESQKGLTFREAQIRRSEFMDFYEKEQKFQDFLYETKLEAYPLEVFANGNVEDSGFDLVNDLDVIEQILFGAHEGNSYQTASSLGDAGSGNSGNSSEDSSKSSGGTEPSSAGEGESVSSSSSKIAVSSSSDSNPSSSASNESSNASSDSSQNSGNSSESSGDSRQNSDNSGQDSGNSAQGSSNVFTDESAELNAFSCNSEPLNTVIQSALLSSKTDLVSNGSGNSADSQNSVNSQGSQNSRDSQNSTASQNDQNSASSQNDTNSQIEPLLNENTDQNAIGEPYETDINSDEQDTGYLSSDGHSIALKNATSRSSSPSLCASIFCIEINLINKSKPKYPNEENCLACHVDFIVDSLYRTIQNSLIPGKIVGNLFEVPICKEATASQLPPDFVADRFVIIGKPISTPVHDDIVKGIDFKKMTSDITKIFTGNSSNDPKGIGNSTFVGNEAARERTYCDPDATPEEKKNCQENLQDRATAFVENTVSDGKTYNDVLDEINQIVSVAEQNAREASHREITKKRLQRSASWYSSIKPEMDQMEEYFRSFRNILFNIREGAAQELCNKKDVVSFFGIAIAKAQETYDAEELAHCDGWKERG
ncbi:hypothetical protein HYV57_04535, partial [Candidatus Peregrinibacteria bacterium]|nr:hypothetical protein [Candidatus Peregrinibacteria bacterium]